VVIDDFGDRRLSCDPTLHYDCGYTAAGAEAQAGEAVMADQTAVETFNKIEVSKTQVEQVRQDHLDSHAKSSEITEDDTNWILTTTWPGGC
jgi:hypothetical protein